MLLKVGALLTAPLLLMALVAGATGVILVDVREGGEDGHHFVIPVPLVLARTALAFAPHNARYIECPEIERFGPTAVKALEEIGRAPDFVLVEVHEGNESVLVRKEGKSLRVDVLDGGEEVHCRIPIATAMRVLEAHDGHGFRTQELLRAFQGAPRGEIVHVKDGGDEVRIRLL